MGNPVVHVQIIAEHPDALQSFYRDAFGWEMLPNPDPGFALMQTGDDAPVNGSIGPAKAGYGGLGVRFLVEVDDLDEALHTVQRLGGETVVAPWRLPPPGPSIAFFADPAGHVVGLVRRHAAP